MCLYTYKICYSLNFQIKMNDEIFAFEQTVKENLHHWHLKYSKNIKGEGEKRLGKIVDFFLNSKN